MENDRCTPAPHDDFDGLRQEHVEIGRILATLERWMQDLRGSPHPEPAVLGHQLGALAAALRPHFAGEEEGSLYCEVPIDCPRFAARLDRLKAEHPAILSDLEQVLALARAPGAAGIPTRELGTRLRRLVATMRRHEAEETEILMHAYWDDLGGGA